ncbi:SRPBCC family protein [Chitinimonas naiadis]
MITTLVLVVVVVLVAILVAAASRPDTFRFERSIVISAPPEKAYELIADMRRWVEWSPWERLDPQLKRAHSGAPSGEGAIYEWDGNNKVGAGRMEILEAEPPVRLLIKLDFLRPFKANNMAEFLLQQQGGQTTLTWAMFGPSNFMSKLMGIFISMDKMLGKDFDAGLASLKFLAERKV